MSFATTPPPYCVFSRALRKAHLPCRGERSATTLWLAALELTTRPACTPAGASPHWESLHSFTTSHSPPLGQPACY